MIAPAQLGELCLWAAFPVLVLAAAAALAGGLAGRADLATLGGRASEAATALLLFAAAGLAFALITVQLKYSYVAEFSGFQLSWPWRLTGLWSGPAGGALVFTTLFAGAAAVSWRREHTRRAAARTGCLAILALVALLIVARARPFAQPDAPALLGAGLAEAGQTIVWQVELAAIYLATAGAAFAFAGTIAGQLVEWRETESSEAVAVAAVAGLLAAAVLAATWRVYGTTGELLDARGLNSVVVYLPAWLVALAFLHAPGGSVAPSWALRWRRMLGVALLPACLGAGAAVLVGLGTLPPAIPWAGGLAVGVIAGATAGMARTGAATEDSRTLPGFGLFAFLGGLVTLTSAGLAAIWGLLGSEFWLRLSSALIFLALAVAATGSVIRPAARWNKVWVSAAVLALTAGAATLAFNGRGGIEYALAAGLLVASLVAAGAELIRTIAASRGRRAVSLPVGLRRVLRARARRRLGSALGHLGLALLVLGVAGDTLKRVDTQPLDPGDSLSLEPAAADGVRITYLGLSRYQVGDVDRRVASFKLVEGDGPSRMVTASSSYDWITRREMRRPALQRGPTRDVIVSLMGFRDGEGIVCRLSTRPLTNLIWLGGALLLAAMLGRGRTIL